MEAIAVNSRLGNVALEIKASLRNDRVNEAAEAAAMHLLFHKAGSKAFNGKDGGHKRDEAFSPELAKDVRIAVLESLGDIFENFDVKTAPYEKVSEVDKIIRSLEKIGAVEAVAALRKQQSANNSPASEESL